MLVFCHLFIGAIVGLVLYQRLHKRWMIPAAALGAVLPDIIDKPLGHLLLQSTLDSGRIFAHSLLFLGFLVAAGLVLYRARSSLLLAVVALGVATHLILDGMWDMPVTLLWPALGPFQPGNFPDYFGISFIEEIVSPMEWLFGLLTLSLQVQLYQDRFSPWGAVASRMLGPLRLPLIAFLIVSGIIGLILGMLAISDSWMHAEPQIILGLSALSGGSFLLKEEYRPSIG